MEKHHSCLNTRAIIEYFQEHFPEEVSGLFRELDPEIDQLPDPQEFLMEINNWVSSRVVIKMFQNARRLSQDPEIAYKIGLDSAARKKLGYVQRIILFAWKNPRRSLPKVQKVNDKFNRNKRVELVEATRHRAVVRLHWFPEVPAVSDFCLFNKGIYTGIPTIWNLPPAILVENKCYFKGDDYCEYQLKWVWKFSLKESLLRMLTPWRALRYTIDELERDKELLKRKFDEVHILNIQLREKIDQLLNLQEALSESEIKYRIVADNTYNWEFWLSQEGRFIYMSPSCQRITGHAAEEFERDPELFFRLIHPDDRARFEAHHRRVESTGGTGELEFRIQLPDGQVRWIGHACQAVFDAEGQFLGTRGSNRDISEKKAAEEQIRTSLREKEVLLKEIHHRVKNNLQIISGLLTIKSHNVNDPAVIEMFRDCRNRIRSMALVHEALYRSGDLAVIDLKDYLERLSQGLVGTYRGKGERIRFFSELESCTVGIDTAIPCGLIISELLSNSLKHAFPDNRTGEIHLGFRVVEDHLLELSLWDNGVGIPESYDPKKTHSLGLRLVTDLVERQLGGAIQFSQEQGAHYLIRFRELKYKKRV
ncbi:MAG: PAS domain S-box protein [Deltaproteobacteria bacterium]|nr:PAS domain S-box protein [Deltaproteobacteria bacterium]